MNRRLSSLLAVVGVLALPASATAATKPPKPAPVSDATVKIVEIGDLHGGRAQIYDTVPVHGTLDPYVPGQKVEVTFYLDGHRLVSHKVTVSKGSGDSGSFESSVVVKQDGKYAVSAKHRANAKLGGDSTVRKSWKVSFPSLHPGECSKIVKGFKQELAKMGYVSGNSSCFNGRLGREVLAYRKVNDMNRSQKAGAGLVQRVFAGKGGYHVRYPKAGEHVEVPLSKQVLVMIKKGKPFAIYPVSTGKPSTPTITGHYTFYRREPGLNAEGMYYSFYWHGGYAVHGYHEVPNYAASHGCVRTFMEDQPRIYDQLHYGESIFVF